MSSNDEYQLQNHMDPVDFDLYSGRMGEFNVSSAIDCLYVLLLQWHSHFSIIVCYCVFPFLIFYTYQLLIRMFIYRLPLCTEN